MTIEQFNDWCNKELEAEIPKLQKKYPKCSNNIREDISDFYLNVIGGVLGKLEDPRNYLYTFIYNRYHRFFAGLRNGDYLLNLKSVKIELSEDVSMYEVGDEDEVAKIELEERVGKIVSSLPLYDQRMYQYYYVEGQTIMEIAKFLGISHNGVHKQIVKLRKKVYSKMVEV